MSIVAEQSVKAQVTPRVLAGLAEEIERQEREDNARGPEPEGRWVLSRGRWVRVAVVPSLPPGFVAVELAESAEPVGVGGADEVRVRRLMIAAMTRFGSARVGGAR